MHARKAATATSARPMTSRWRCSRAGSRTTGANRRARRLGLRLVERGAIRSSRSTWPGAPLPPRRCGDRPAPTICPMTRNARVLVVEDDVEIAGALRRSLALEGYDVELAGDGVAALDRAEVYEPDAV